MEDNKRDKKNRLSNVLVMIVSLMYFMLCGIFIGNQLGTIMQKAASSPLKAAVYIAGTLLTLYLCLFIHLCLHEMGHLIFGHISGYRFKSIRFGSLIIYETDGRLKLGKYTLAGTGGQCIMMPPDIPVNELPTKLYNWGGIIVNLIITLPSVVILSLTDRQSFAHLTAGIWMLIGIFIILTNGIPIDTLGNDGHNALTLDKDFKAKQAFAVSLKIICALQTGISIKDFPAEWFDWSYEDGDSSLASSLGVQKVGWLVANQRFNDAFELADYIDKNIPSLALTLQMTNKLERLFSTIMLEADSNEITKAFETEKKSFNALKQIPSTMRTLFAYHKLISGDNMEADKAIKLFEKIAIKYPYPKEIESERELIHAVEDLYAKRNKD